MTDRPTKDDFDRTLSTLANRALNQLQVERNQIKGQAAAIGALHGNQLIIAIADAADKIHVSTMAQVTTTLHEFTQRMELSPTQITAWARPGLENFGNTLLAQIAENGFPADHQRIVAEHRVKFIKRLDAALRDVVIGLGGSANSRAPTPKPEIFHLKPGMWGVSVDLKALFKKFYQWLFRREANRDG